MAGPHFLPNGDVISSALSMDEAPHAGNELFTNNKLEIGQIVSIYTVDNTENVNSNQDDIQARFTLYDVRITRPNGASELIPRCRIAQPTFGGGINNFFEVLPTDPGFDNNNFEKSKELKRGHFVIVGFISGRKDNAVILGMMPHTNPVAINARPKKGLGTFAQGEIQGLNFKVDNDGALNIVFNGPRDDNGGLVNQNGPTTIQIDKNGIINLSTNKSQSVSIDRVSGLVTITNGPTSIKMDQNADQIDVVAKKINVGAGGLQPQIVGDDMVAWLSDLVDQINLIVVPTGVGPSGNPINAAAFSSLKSQLKDKIQSKKHWVEK